MVVARVHSWSAVGARIRLILWKVTVDFVHAAADASICALPLKISPVIVARCGRPRLGVYAKVQVLVDVHVFDVDVFDADVIVL